MCNLYKIQIEDLDMTNEPMKCSVVSFGILESINEHWVNVCKNICKSIFHVPMNLVGEHCQRFQNSFECVWECK